MSRPRVEVVLGLGFGDEGKGTLVDWLARRGPGAPLVVRWNGGPQAAHHVVTDDGRTHCFAQLGAASFVAGARTHLGPDMAVDPYALHAEAAALAGAGVDRSLATVTIDPRAVLVTPWHAIVNRVREELRGEGRHGSTGRGVGEAKLGAASITAGQIGAGLAGAAASLRAALAREAAALLAAAPAPAPDSARALVARAGDRDLLDAFLDAARGLAPAGVRVSAAPPPAEHLILEGAQGALLDRDHGFFPHVTPSRITRAAAEQALRDMNLPGPTEVWGVLRAYHTRHGEGPFPSHDPALSERLPEQHNRSDGWQGRFRVGWFDAVLARHALSFAGPIDRLALTCLDRLAHLAQVRVVQAWRGAPDARAAGIADLAPVSPDRRTAIAAEAVAITRTVADVSSAVRELLGRRVDLESWGPSAGAKRPA